MPRRRLAPSCNPGTYGDTSDTTGDPQCMECPKGHQCLGSSIEPMACPVATYSGAGSGTSRGICTECAKTLSHATTLSVMSDAETDCCCSEAFYETETAEGQRICEPCDEERAACDRPGISLRTLPLEPGFWRVSETSVELRACPTPESCIGGTVCSANRTSPNCNADNLCEVGHRGPLCLVCERKCIESSAREVSKPASCSARTNAVTSLPCLLHTGGFYKPTDQSSCVTCDGVGGVAAYASVGGIALAVTALALIAWRFRKQLKRKAHEHQQQRWFSCCAPVWRAVGRILNSQSLRNKIKA